MRNVTKKTGQILDEVSKMKRKFLMVSVVAASAAFLYTPLVWATPMLGSATDFAVLAHTTVTNTGPTVIFGSAATLANVGVYNNGDEGDASTGFAPTNTYAGPGSHTDGPGLVKAPAAIHLGDSVANLARTDLITSYSALKSYGTASNLSGLILGDGGTILSLGPGVYSFDSTAQLNGTLTLDAGGLNGQFWVFQIGSSLTTASASAVKFINAPNNGADAGVFWVVGTGGTGSATLGGGVGVGTKFEGNILAQDSITLVTDSTILNGRALAITGAVTLDSNVISDICPTAAEELSNGVVGPGSSSPNSGPGFSGGLELVNGEAVPIGPGPSPVPEPGTMMLLSAGFLGLAVYCKRRKNA